MAVASSSVASTCSSTALFLPSAFEEPASIIGLLAALTAEWQRLVLRSRARHDFTWVEHVDSSRLILLLGRELREGGRPFKQEGLVARWVSFGCTLKDLDLGGRCAEGVTRDTICAFVSDGIVSQFEIDED